MYTMMENRKTEDALPNFENGTLCYYNLIAGLTPAPSGPADPSRPPLEGLPHSLGTTALKQMKEDVSTAE
jgi:hypothetical protein